MTQLATPTLLALLLLPLVPVHEPRAVELGVVETSDIPIEHANCLHANVANGASLQPLTAASVTVVRDSGAATGITNTGGNIEFPGMPVASWVETSDPLDVWIDSLPHATFVVEKEGFVPVMREVNGCVAGHQFELMPLRSGAVTPLIDADSGGTIRLPGLGILRVQPGALANDAQLLVLDLPSSTWSTGIATETCLSQFYVTALDIQGDFDMSLIDPSGGSIKLSLPSDRFLDARPSDEISDETWSVLQFDDDFTLIDDTHAEFEFGDSVGTITIGAGRNYLGYACWTPGECTNWSPWTIELVEGPLSIPNSVDATFNCGVYDADYEGSVSEGQEFTGTLSLSTEVSAETGVTAKSALASASAKSGVKVTAGATATTATSTTTKAGAKVTAGQGINGRPASELGVPEKCLSGTRKFGVKKQKYYIWATRRCVNPDGSIDRESKHVGEIEVFSGFGGIYTCDVVVDTACGAECAQVELPEKYKCPENFE